MSIITALLPNGSQVHLDIADNTLVYNGAMFDEPQDAPYVKLFQVPVNAISLPFEGQSQQLITDASVYAKVLSYDLTSRPSTDPSVDAQPDPSGGTCLCFLTCQGTWLSYVQVTLA
jgi:hypothetical protein